MAYMADATTAAEKKNIAAQIKHITPKMRDLEMDKLIEIGKNANSISPRSRIGNNVVDFFTFPQRLETRGKYDVNFFEFLQNIDEFKKKKFIQTMLNYYNNVKNKNSYGTLSFYYLIEKYKEKYKYLYIADYFDCFSYKKNLQGFEYWNGEKWE